MATPDKKSALVTGGSRGIGLGIARELAANGFNIAINGRRPQADVEDALSELRELGAEVLYCQADVAVASDRQTMVDSVYKHFGRLDALINNAGVAPNVRADLLEASEESFERLMRINLQGPYFLTQLVAKRMIEQPAEKGKPRGAIVNVSSVSATLASTNRGEYCISKAGVAMATQLWAMRLAEFDIPVYEVRPGVITTDMTAGVKDKYDAMIADGLTLEPRWGTTEDVGKAVAVLARGDLPYATGNVLMVDGGLALPRL